MTPPPNYYDLLGIPSDADDEAIRQATARENSKWNQRKSMAASVEKRREAEDMVRAIAEARKVLLDAAQRREYDALLTPLPQTLVPQEELEALPIAPHVAQGSQPLQPEKPPKVTVKLVEFGTHAQEKQQEVAKKPLKVNTERKLDLEPIPNRSAAEHAQALSELLRSESELQKIATIDGLPKEKKVQPSAKSILLLVITWFLFFFLCMYIFGGLLSRKPGAISSLIIITGMSFTLVTGTIILSALFSWWSRR